MKSGIAYGTLYRPLGQPSVNQAYVRLADNLLSSFYVLGSQGTVGTAVDAGGVAGRMQFTCTDLQNPSEPGTWDPFYWDDNTRELIWDLSGYDMTGVLDAGWMQISFSVDSDIGPGYWYIDNVRLVNPEPTAIALFGLGSLVLLLRRR